MLKIRNAAILETGDRLYSLLRPIAQAHACRLIHPAPGEKLRCTMLIVAPDWQQEAPGAVCRILLTPPDKMPLLGKVEAERVISFGASARESISFSSLTPDSLTLSVRRELPTLSGRKLEMQERPMRCAPGTPEEMLAFCAAALLLDDGS